MNIELNKAWSKNRITLALILFMAAPFAGFAQSSLNTYARKQKGIGLVTSDSLFSLNFQFRMQNRAIYVSKAGSDLAPEGFEFLVRRLRMKFEGFVYNPKLTYYIQLSFARGDMDWRSFDNSTVNFSPNVIRDAVIFYSPTSRLKLEFGQTKLPGNRQRVVSSGDLQFFDRSIVNARFNIDRDFGFFAHYTTPFVIFRGALSSGEGRNVILSNNGLAYTGRVEFLPLGKFKGNNDYVEGDLEREESLKVSLGSTYSYNESALRQAGQLGNDLYAPRSLNNYEVDLLLKYSGWAWYTEFQRRATSNPITTNASNQIRTVYDGAGFMSQTSYLFKNNFEVAGRYSLVNPSSRMYNNSEAPSLNEKQVKNYELGVTRYFMGHRLKVQGGLIYSELTDLRIDAFHDDFWTVAFQVELGI